MNFKKGQRVLCVNDHFRSYCASPVKKGMIYKIDGFYRCPCGSDQLILKEKPDTIDMRCRCGYFSYRRQSYYSWRFIPLELFENFIDLSEKKKISEEIIMQNTESGKEEIKKILGSVPVGKINLHNQSLN